MLGCVGPNPTDPYNSMLSKRMREVLSVIAQHARLGDITEASLNETPSPVNGTHPRCTIIEMMFLLL